MTVKRTANFLALTLVFVALFCALSIFGQQPPQLTDTRFVSSRVGSGSQAVLSNARKAKARIAVIDQRMRKAPATFLRGVDDL